MGECFSSQNMHASLLLWLDFVLKVCLTISKQVILYTNYLSAINNWLRRAFSRMNFFQTILLMLQSVSLCISLENGVSGHLALDQLIFDNRAPENVKTGMIFEFIRHYEKAKMSLNLESFLVGSSWSLHVREPGFHNQGNLETWAWESGIPLTIGISNPSSTVKVPSPVPGIRNPQLGIYNSIHFWIHLHGAKLAWYCASFVDIH